MRALFLTAVTAALTVVALPAASRDGGAPDSEARAPTVKLKLEVYPKSAHAVVMWGAKKLGPPPVELERPRGSGPIDLVVRAEGHLDHHTRLFTDRNDRLSVTLRPASGRSSGSASESSNAVPVTP